MHQLKTDDSHKHLLAIRKENVCRVSEVSRQMSITKLVHDLRRTYGAALVTNLRFNARRLVRVGTRFWTDLSVVATAVTIALVAHFIEIGAWASLFVLIGVFQAWGIALYHSTTNYTSLGYADIVMSPAWKILGPVEAIVGLLMFGVSTAMIFTVAQRLVYARFPDLRA
jgi:hypothetical protein